MNPQTLLAVRAVIIFVAGIFASRGIISQDTATYLASTEAMAFIGTATLLATGAWGLWLNRPKAVVANAGKLLEGKGAVIAPPSIADSSVTGPNVVSTVAEAVRLPGVQQ